MLTLKQMERKYNYTLKLLTNKQKHLARNILVLLQLLI